MTTFQARLLGYASRPEAEIALFISALIEMLFFPVSADLLLISMVLVNFDRAFRYAMIATGGAVTGGIISYIFGFLTFASVGSSVIAKQGWESSFFFLQSVFADYNVLLVVAAGLAVIPFKIISLISGFFSANLPSFVMACIVSRGASYFLIAWLLWRGGHRYQVWIERYFQGLSMVMALGLLLTFVMILVLVQTS